MTDAGLYSSDVEGTKAFPPRTLQLSRADRSTMNRSTLDRATLDRASPERLAPDASDAERLNDLLARVARDHDRAAFAELFRHFAPRLKSYLMRLGADPGSAEEVVQEVMVTVWRRAESFDPALASAATWIFTIARNRRIDILRREKRPEIDPDDPALVPDAPEPADRLIQAGQDTRKLREAMRALPAEQAELLRMAYFEDKPHSAIAAESGLPLGTVKSRLRLALARLRKAMGEDAA